MDEPNSNDNDVAAAHGEPLFLDAYGQAALLLVESLIHTLIELSALKVNDALNVVSVAIDARKEIALDAGELPDQTAKSLQLLNAIHQTLSIDLPVR